MRVVVVGGGGFIGRAFAVEATRRDAVCISIGRKPRQQADYCAIDLTLGWEATARLLSDERPDLVVDVSGVVAAQEDLLVANITPTRNLLLAIDRVQAFDPRIVVIGSAAEYGDLGSDPISEGARELPVTEYGVAKLARTRLALAARHRGRRVLVVRPFNILGPAMPASMAPARFALAALDAIRRGSRELTVGDLSTQRDYLDVEDVARAIWGLSTAEVSDPIVNVCSGQPIRTADVLSEILLQLNAKLDCRVDPRLIRGAEEIPVSLGNPSRLAQILGERPRFNLQRSVRRLIDSLRFPQDATTP